MEKTGINGGGVPDEGRRRVTGGREPVRFPTRKPEKIEVKHRADPDATTE